MCDASFIQRRLCIDTRRALNIEDHWSRANKPSIDVSPLNSKAYDARFEELLQQYPIPDGYDDADGTSAGTDAGVELGRGNSSSVSPSAAGRVETVISKSILESYKNSIVMEPFAMKSALAFARNSSKSSNSVDPRSDTKTSSSGGRIRRKSITRNTKK